MTALHETAYPRLKSEFSERDLQDVYTPTPEELAFVFEQRRQPQARLALLLLLKTCQRLGYFMLLSEVPERIKKHIARSVPNSSHTRKKQLLEYDQSGARQRFLKLLRCYLNIKAFDEPGQALVEQTMLSAAETRQQLPDIINIAIEELVRQRYELPGFSRLQRTAVQCRKRVNEAYYTSL